MRSLIAIKSCPSHKDREDAQRRTWATSHTAWFTGIMLGVPDDYKNLPFKTQAICQQSFKMGYDRIFLADTDSYVALDRLLSYPLYEYAGYELPGGYASGGAGYWLDRNAMFLVAKAECSPGNEDEWVGSVMRQNGISLHHDPRFSLFVPCLPDNDIISQHLSSRGPYDLQMMFAAHEHLTSVPHR